MSWYLCCILKIRNLKKPFFLSILCQVVEVQDAKLDTSNALVALVECWGCGEQFLFNLDL